MRNLLTKATFAVTLGAAALTTAAPAEAQRYRHYDRHRGDGGAAIVAGVAGLAIGAALASGRRDRYYDNGYYDRGYYRDRYYAPRYYNYRPRCVTRRVYDPYIGRRVRVRYC